MMTSNKSSSVSEPQTLLPKTTLQELPLWETQIELDCLGQEAVELFHKNPLLPGILLMEQQQYQGMISRRQFFEQMSRPFSLEIFSKRSLQVFYDFARVDILILPQTTSVADAVKQALGRSLALVYEPIVVETETTYALLDVYQLLLAYSDLYSSTTTALKDTKIKAIEQENKLKRVLSNQTQLIQAEKMSSLGQLVAGIAHEINNPVNFIFGNLTFTRDYVQELLELVQLYQKKFPHAGREIQAKSEEIDLDFLIEDLPKMLLSMKIGAERIQEIVLSLRNFSRLDEAKLKIVDIHEGIESTLLLLRNRLRASSTSSEIQVIRKYSELPLIQCYVSQLNQVFMNILMNAIDVLESDPRPTWRHPKTITIQTKRLNSNLIAIQIVDNGPGMSEEVKQRLFDPFFTTKPVGKGTGLGLSISYQIVAEMHRGRIRCVSAPGQGTEFWIEIPVQQGRAN